METFIEGIAVPYTIQNDDFITGVLYATVLIVIVALAQSRDFLAREFKFFFRESGNDFASNTETATEVRFQFFLVFQTCLVLGLATYLFVTHYSYVIVDSQSPFFNSQSPFFNSQSPIFNSPNERPFLIMTFVGCFIVYFVLKAILQNVVGWVYFEPQENRLWQKSQLLIVAFEGLPLLPIVLLLCYFSLKFQAALVLCILAVTLTKGLTFYRCHQVFFKNKRFGFQSVLYFLTLEVVPLVFFYSYMMTSATKQ